MTAVRYRLLDAALARGAMPDPLLRMAGIWGAFARERRECRGGVEVEEQRLRFLLNRMSSGPIAEATEKANEQHYELPPRFMELVLGPRLKYSACLWDSGIHSLGQAEEAMLGATCSRAQIEDGMRILDLGCGWGSLSLWLAERYPDAEIVAISNAQAQRRYIEGRAGDAGIRNLTVQTADMSAFVPEGRFDRVISIEMFEHMRNWRELFRRVSSWLTPGGKAFVQVFSHRTLPYLFDSTWAAERFFTAGLMPSHDLMLHFQDDLRVVDRWALPGTHYARTLDAWLANLDANRDELLAVLEQATCSATEARRLVGTWRLFLIGTSRMWNRDRGGRWMVSQYLLAPRLAQASRRQWHKAGGATDVDEVLGTAVGDVALKKPLAAAADQEDGHR